MFVAVAFITISIIFAFQQSNIKYIDEIDSKINLDIKEYKDINDKFLEQDINLIFSWPKIKKVIIILEVNIVVIMF